MIGRRIKQKNIGMPVSYSLAVEVGGGVGGGRRLH